MDRERLWDEIMKLMTAVDKMEKDTSPKLPNVIKRREADKERLKATLIGYAKRLHEEGDLKTELKTYEEISTSSEMTSWLVDHAPEGFEVGKDDIYRSKKALNQRRIAERELKLNSIKVDDVFLENYIKSCGYESADELTEKDITYIAKRFKVAGCVVEEKAKSAIRKLSR